MRVRMELYRDADGHFCGSAGPDGGRGDVPFHGMLELARILEDLRPGPPPADQAPGSADGPAGGPSEAPLAEE